MKNLLLLLTIIPLALGQPKIEKRALVKNVLPAVDLADQKYFSEKAASRLCLFIKETESYRCYLEIDTSKTGTAFDQYFVILVHKIARDVPVPMPRIYGDHSFTERFGEDLWPAIRQKIPNFNPASPVQIIIQNHVAGWYVCFVDGKLSVTQTNPHNVVAIGTVTLSIFNPKVLLAPYRRGQWNQWDLEYAGLRWAPDQRNVTNVRANDPFHSSILVGSIDRLIANIDHGPQWRYEFVEDIKSKVSTGGTKETEEAWWRAQRERQDGTAKKRADAEKAELAYRQRKLGQIAANRTFLRERYTDLLVGLDAEMVRRLSSQKLFDGYENGEFLQRVFSGDFLPIFSFDTVVGTRPDWVAAMVKRRRMIHSAYAAYHNVFEKKFGDDRTIAFQKVEFSFSLEKKVGYLTTTTPDYASVVYRIRPPYAARFDDLSREWQNSGLGFPSNHKSFTVDFQRFLSLQSPSQSLELRIFEINLFFLAEEGLPPLQVLLQP